MWRYADRLPVEPLVTLGEGDTPLVPAPVLSERVGAEVWLKLEGANPTGSFKDRGMTVAVSAAVGEGAEAVICASTGNTAASAAAYAARAGLRGAVIVPEGKIATGKLAQALMHGARVIALRGNFDQALQLVRELVERHPIALVNSVNDFRIEGQKTGAFEVCDQLGEPPDVLCIPVGNAGNVTSWWKGFQEYEAAPRLHGYQAEGAAPLVHGAPVEAPETVASAIRIGNPARWEDAMNAFTASRGEVRAVSDEEILDAYALLGEREGVFCEPASAASVAGLLRYGAEGRVVCVLTGHGLKDPQTAMNRAAPVVPCEPDLEERGEGGPRAGEAPPPGAGAGQHGQPRPGLRRPRRRAVDRADPRGRGDGRVLRPLRRRPGCPRTARTCASGPSRRSSPPTASRSRSAPTSRLPPASAPAPPRSWPASAPPTTSTSSTRRCSSWRGSWRATPTTWPPPCTAASWSARTTSPQRFDPPPGLEAVVAIPPEQVATDEARAALPAEVPLEDAVHNVAHASLLMMGIARDDFSLIGRGLADRLHQPRRAHLYPRSMELLERAQELGAIGATISGAGPTVLFWCTWQQTGNLVERLRAEAPDCEVRRVQFAPYGADVKAL